MSEFEYLKKVASSYKVKDNIKYSTDIFGGNISNNKVKNNKVKNNEGKNNEGNNIEKRRRKIVNKNTCDHKDIFDDGCIMLCIECGEEIQANVYTEKFKGNSNIIKGNNQKKSYEADRCEIRKSADKNIFDDVKEMGISDDIIFLANQIYICFTNNSTRRGNNRKGIIFACVLKAHHLLCINQTPENLLNLFNIPKKKGSKSIKELEINLPNVFKKKHYISADVYIRDIMKNFNINSVEIEEVIDIYENIKNRSDKINRSKSHSIASGIIYYWILSNKKRISSKEFSKFVGLSELTVKSMADHVKGLME